MNWGDQVEHGQSILHDSAKSLVLLVRKYNFQIPSSIGTACAAGSMCCMHRCTYCMYRYGFFVTELLGNFLGLTRCPIREVS